MIFDIIARLWSEPGFPVFFITCIALLIAENVAESNMDMDE